MARAWHTFGWDEEVTLIDTTVNLNVFEKWDLLIGQRGESKRNSQNKKEIHQPR